MRVGCSPTPADLQQEAQQDTGCYSRTDDTGHIGTHGVHQQVVAGVLLQTDGL